MREPSHIVAEPPESGALSLGRKGVIEGPRRATPDDIPAMLDMGRRFIEKAWSRIGVGYCEESCTILLYSLMESGVLLVAPDRTGMIGLVVHPWHFNSSVLTATEVFWWSEGEYGGALREAAENHLRAIGVPTVNMACEHHMRSAALDRLYRINGYEPSEHIYMKVLH